MGDDKIRRQIAAMCDEKACVVEEEYEYASRIINDLWRILDNQYRDVRFLLDEHARVMGAPISQSPSVRQSSSDIGSVTDIAAPSALPKQYLH